MTRFTTTALLILAVGVAGCDSTSPTQVLPSPSLSAPTPLSPLSEQLPTVRPTLRIGNATSDQEGVRTYEFQVSDNSSFTGDNSVGKAGVAEGSDGQTEYTLEQDLQFATEYHWRSRATQVTASGTHVSAWSSIGQFRSRPPDPTIGAPTLSAPAFGSTVSTVSPIGLRINNSSADQQGGRSYEFQLGENPDLAGAVSQTTPETAGTTTLTIPAKTLEGGKNMFWRARLILATSDLTPPAGFTEIHGTFAGPWSEVFRFFTRIPDPTIGQPRNISPPNNFQLTEARPTFTFQNATVDQDGVKTYDFEIADNTNFVTSGGRGINMVVQEDPGGTTTVTLTQDLVPGKVYHWHARMVIVAESGNGTFRGPYSNPTSVKSIDEGFIRGKEVYDPLTNFKTVGKQKGGRFTEKGWMSTSLRDGIDYDIQTCSDCKLEFDVTGVGRAEGLQVLKDLDFISMGDGATYSNFTAFRNHPWKMHLEQRSDGNGTGMKIIWRNGGFGGGNPGDHDIKVDPAVNWQSDQTFHFELEWDPGGFIVSVNGRVWFRDSFGGRAYAPPRHRISLGDYPRTETIGPGAIWSNVRVTPN